MLRSRAQHVLQPLVKDTSRLKAVNESYLALSTFFRQQQLSKIQDHHYATLQLSSSNKWRTRTASTLVSRHLIGQPRAYATTSTSNAQEPPEKSADRGDTSESSNSAESNKSSKGELDAHAHVSSFPRSLRRLALSLPTSGLRRPTKEELLSRTSSFFERLRIRFKWFTIRGFRRFRADDWSAFVSWILGGVGLWIAVGTTSFASAIFFLLNSLQMQEWMAASLGSYLTSQSGVTIVFESAIVPKFSLRDSKLTFRNVYVSRGMSGEDVESDGDDEGLRKRDSRITSRVRRASSEALANLKSRDSLHREARRAASRSKQQEEAVVDETDEAIPYTHFHLSIDSVEVALSLPRWLDGKGLVKEAVVKGVRGVVDRSHIVHKPSTGPTDHRQYRRTAHPGDFHLESLNVEDFLVTIYQPENFRPYTFSVFSAYLTNLRKQWLFFDLLSAESITGQVDNCLFSLHRPQTIGRTSQDDMKDNTWKRMSRFRVDGVPVDHLQTAQDAGPLGWILSGKADLVADIRFPREPGDDIDINSIIGDIVDNLDEALRSPSSLPNDRIPGRPVLAGGKPLESPSASLRSILGIEADGSVNPESRVVSIDLDLRFKDVRAAVPLFIPHLSNVSNALVRPIVAFLNSNRTLIPIKCHVDIALSEFDGSWTTYDIGLLDAVALQVYDALAHHVQEKSNVKTATTVGLWSLQRSAAAVLTALRQNLDHM